MQSDSYARSNVASHLKPIFRGQYLLCFAMVCYFSVNIKRVTGVKIALFVN